MTNLTSEPENTDLTPEKIDNTSGAGPGSRKLKSRSIFPIIFIASLTLVFASGVGSGYLLWGRNSSYSKASGEMEAMVNAINPKEGFKIQAKYGDVGPKLLAAGAIDLKTFEQLYQESGRPLSDKEIEVLIKGSQDQLVINRQNAHFLLNFFWALGLANKNPILDKGLIQQVSDGQIDGFASTGGWTIGQKPVTELFSSTPILSLSEDQQARVEEVAKAVYRPCCDNPTDLPDCNHGMAMLGLLELMASQNASIDEMFTAAKYVNAFWFPQQTLEQAVYFNNTQKLKYADIDARMIVSPEYSSISGFQQVHQWLANNGLLEQAPKGGSNCGV
jgi:hypothetical protein